MSNAAIVSTREKVRRMLTDKLGSVMVTNDDRFLVRHNSAVVFISVEEGFGDGTIVKVEAPLISKVDITLDLLKWIAFDGQNFKIGGCILLTDEAGKGMIIFKYTLTADDLDESELMNAVLGVTFVSDDLDNKLRDRFGGELFGSE